MYRSSIWSLPRFGPGARDGLKSSAKLWTSSFAFFPLPVDLPLEDVRRDEDRHVGALLIVIVVPKELADDLWLWKERCPNSSPDAFIFPNKKGGFMDSNNYRNRVLHGLAQELELPKLTFQVIRRTIATLAQKKGTVKDIQGVLRHSRIATTTDVYMQEIPESVQKTVDAISAELRLLPNLEEVTRGTSVLLPNATKLKSGVSASS